MATVYALSPDKFRTAAKRFLDDFPGDTLFAIKANPAPHVLDQVYAAGIRHFDTASLAEIETREEPLPRRALPLHGARSRDGRGEAAFTKYGVRDFVVDCDYELDKLLAETKGGPSAAHLRAHCHASGWRGARTLQQIRHNS